MKFEFKHMIFSLYVLKLISIIQMLKEKKE